MHAVQVFESAANHAGWREVEVINELEVGWCYAVTSSPTKCAKDEAVMLAGLLATATGERFGVVDLTTGQRCFDTEKQTI